jgi:hypothetical protein
MRIHNVIINKSWHICITWWKEGGWSRDYLDIGGMSHPSEGLGDPFGRALQQGAFIMIASSVEASFIL